MERWERRERRKKAERERMAKHGRSVRLLHALIQRRAAQARRAQDGPQASPPGD